MKWTQFHLITTKTLYSAVIAIFLIPVVADLLLKLGLDYNFLKIPISGGFIYIAGFALYKYYTPSVLEENPSKQALKNWAIDNNINIFDELKEVFKLTDAEKKKLLGSDESVFYPPDKGLRFSRVECIKRYTEIEFDLLDTLNPILRAFILLIFLISIVMINWLSIERLFRVMWG